MKVREKKNGRIHHPSPAVWDSIVANGNGHKFEVIEAGEVVKPIATKTEIPVTLEEKQTRPGRKNKSK